MPTNLKKPLLEEHKHCKVFAFNSVLPKPIHHNLITTVTQAKEEEVLLCLLTIKMSKYQYYKNTRSTYKKQHKHLHSWTLQHDRLSSYFSSLLRVGLVQLAATAKQTIFSNKYLLISFWWLGSPLLSCGQEQIKDCSVALVSNVWESKDLLPCKQTYLKCCVKGLQAVTWVLFHSTTNPNINKEKDFKSKTWLADLGAGVQKAA